MSARGFCIFTSLTKGRDQVARFGQKTTSRKKNAGRLRAVGDKRRETPLLVDDIRNIEHDLADAYAVLQKADARKKDATEAAKEAPVRVNSLVSELVRRLNGEQPLPFNQPPAESETEE